MVEVINDHRHSVQGPSSGSKCHGGTIGIHCPIVVVLVVDDVIVCGRVAMDSKS